MGDIGELTDKVLFQRRGNVQDKFGLSFGKKPAAVRLPAKGNASNHYQIKTGNGAEVEVLAKGSAGLVNGGLKVTFKKENSFFFNLAGVVVQEIDDQLSLAEQIIKLYKEDKWQRDWCIITGIIYSSSATVLGSGTGNHSVLLEAKNDVPVLDLQNAELQFTLRGSHQLAYEMVSGKGAAPLFKLSRLRYKFWKGLGLGMTEDETDLDEVKAMALNEGADLNEFIELQEIGHRNDN